MVFRSNMRSNWQENRFNPYTFAGEYGVSKTYAIKEAKTARAALREAGLFKIDSWKMQVANPYSETWEAISDRMLVSIPDDHSHVTGWNDHFLGVVTEHYKTLQPEWIATLWDEYVRGEDDKPVPVTGIRLNKARSHMVISSEIGKYEVKARNGNGGRKVGDVIKSFMVLDAPFMPGSSVKLSAGDLRLICTNGLTSNQSRMRVTVPHMGDAEETIRKVMCGLYGYSLEAAARNEQLFNQLAKHIMRPVQIEWILDSIFPLPQMPENEFDPRYTSRAERYDVKVSHNANVRADILTMAGGAAVGSHLETATLKGGVTAWGLVNAVGNFLDAKRTRSFESMTYDMINGDRAKVVGDVIERAMQIVEGKAPEKVYV